MKNRKEILAKKTELQNKLDLFYKQQHDTYNLTIRNQLSIKIGDTNEQIGMLDWVLKDEKSEQRTKLDLS